MAEARKIGHYNLRKKSADLAEKENRPPVEKKRVLKSSVEKNRPLAELSPRKDCAETNKFKFKEPPAFRVYVDNDNENDGDRNVRGAEKRLNEKRSKDGLERKDTLRKREKVISNKNEERVVKSRLPAIPKPDIKSQQRKDGNKLAHNIPAIVITRRSSCTDATEEIRILPKTSLRKAASATSLPAATREDISKKPKRLFASKALKRTTSVLSLAVSQQGKEDLSKKPSPAGKPALRNGERNKRNLLAPDANQIPSNATSGLSVVHRPRAKSEELLESKGKALQSEVPESNKIKRTEKKWRIRFRSTDESVFKKLKPVIERKTSAKDCLAGGLQEPDQAVFKGESVKKHIPSASSKKPSDICLQPFSLNKEEQIITITPDDGAPIPSPKKAKLEHKKCEPETGEGRQFPEIAARPSEIAYHLQYLDDAVETEWEKEKCAYKLSADYLKRNINAEQRRIIVGFLINVGYHCHYPSFILYQTVKLFDAAMDVTLLDITEFQLAALACLFISIKKEENIHKVPTASTILSFAKDQYEGKVDLLLKCEQLILRELDFQIAFADPYTLFVYYLFHCKQYVAIKEELTSQLYYSASYMIDISLLDEDFCNVPAILLGITVAELLFCIFLDEGMDYEHPRWLYWRSLIERDRKTPERFCSRTIDTLRGNLIRNALRSCHEQSSYKTVYKKHKLNRYGKISDILMAKIVKLPWDQYSGFR